MENDINPFTPDSSIPEISSSGGESGFTFPDGDPIPPESSNRKFPWKWFTIIAGIILCVVLISAGLVLLLPKVINTPERTVQSYYAALQARDVGRMQEYLDPADPISQNSAPALLAMERYINNYSASLGLQIGINWELQNLTYKLIESSNDSAKVEVTGQLRLYETSTNLGIPLAYNMTHELVWKNRHWYITTKGQPSNH